jgi:hypothetical protein
MSGVDVTKEQKETQVHECESCMNTVVHTFRFLQEQIVQLKQEKFALQMELEKSQKQKEQQKQMLNDEIKALEDKIVALKKFDAEFEG